MSRVGIKPELIRWARRSGHDDAYMRKRFPELPDWKSGGSDPITSRLEKFAKVLVIPTIIQKESGSVNEMSRKLVSKRGDDFGDDEVDDDGH